MEEVLLGAWEEAALVREPALALASERSGRGLASEPEDASSLAGLGHFDPESGSVAYWRQRGGALGVDIAVASLHDAAESKWRSVEVGAGLCGAPFVSKDLLGLVSTARQVFLISDPFHSIKRNEPVYRLDAAPSSSCWLAGEGALFCLVGMADCRIKCLAMSQRKGTLLGEKVVESPVKSSGSWLPSFSQSADRGVVTLCASTSGDFALAVFAQGAVVAVRPEWSKGEKGLRIRLSKIEPIVQSGIIVRARAIPCSETSFVVEIWTNQQVGSKAQRFIVDVDSDLNLKVEDGSRLKASEYGYLAVTSDKDETRIVSCTASTNGTLSIGGEPVNSDSPSFDFLLDRSRSLSEKRAQLEMYFSKGESATIIAHMLPGSRKLETDFAKLESKYTESEGGVRSVFDNLMRTLAVKLWTEKSKILACRPVKREVGFAALVLRSSGLSAALPPPPDLTTEPAATVYALLEDERMENARKSLIHALSSNQSLVAFIDSFAAADAITSEDLETAKPILPSPKAIHAAALALLDNFCVQQKRRPQQSAINMDQQNVSGVLAHGLIRVHALRTASFILALVGLARALRNRLNEDGNLDDATVFKAMEVEVEAVRVLQASRAALRLLGRIPASRSLNRPHIICALDLIPGLFGASASAISQRRSPACLFEQDTSQMEQANPLWAWASAPEQRVSQLTNWSSTMAHLFAGLGLFDLASKSGVAWTLAARSADDDATLLRDLLNEAPFPATRTRALFEATILLRDARVSGNFHAAVEAFKAAIPREDPTLYLRDVARLFRDVSGPSELGFLKLVRLALPSDPGLLQQTFDAGLRSFQYGECVAMLREPILDEQARRTRTEQLATRILDKRAFDSLLGLPWGDLGHEVMEKVVQIATERALARPDDFEQARSVIAFLLKARLFHHSARVAVQAADHASNLDSEVEALSLCVSAAAFLPRDIHLHVNEATGAVVLARDVSQRLALARLAQALRLKNNPRSPRRLLSLVQQALIAHAQQRPKEDEVESNVRLLVSRCLEVFDAFAVCPSNQAPFYHALGALLATWSQSALEDIGQHAVESASSAVCLRAFGRGFFSAGGTYLPDFLVNRFSALNAREALVALFVEHGLAIEATSTAESLVPLKVDVVTPLELVSARAIDSALHCASHQLRRAQDAKQVVHAKRLKSAGEDLEHALRKYIQTKKRTSEFVDRMPSGLHM